MENKDLTLEEYLEIHNGEEFPLDDNLCECEKWIIGEYRCSCGAVRPFLVKESWGYYADIG